MKRFFYILSLILLSSSLLANTISESEALQIASDFMNAPTINSAGKRVARAPRRFARMQQPIVNNQHFYIFNSIDGNGFVIISADDCATPILGYSDEGGIDLNNLPIQLSELLQAYSEEIQFAIDNNLSATDSVEALWTTCRRAPQSLNTTTAVSALISTSWNQEPYYNDMCPFDPTLSPMGSHPSTGCVATAMAQVMKYWEYPETGVGFKSYKSEQYGTLSANFANTTYDWANMPLMLTATTSALQNNAVATLMYHCGVAVSMNYNSDGQGSSGALVIDVGSDRASAERALKTYFGYSSSIQGKRWTSSVSTTTWTNMLKTELNNNRPVLYAGYSPNGGGHAFVCDGYDSSNRFHFNWGWGGAANGYFSLTALTPASYNFTLDQQAVIGIKPEDGTGPAKNYDLYMNTDLTPTNLSSSSASTNIYSFGSDMSFTAKVENNGTGLFQGSFRVAIFSNTGELMAWSKESYHFSLGVGQTTVQKTYTFDGGYPFVPGTYRAYMYYIDDNETSYHLVKTDVGVFLTEYNNVGFSIQSSGDLKPVSDFVIGRGSFTVGSTIRIDVSVKNTALLTSFYGKIRLNLYNSDGTRAQILDELDYSSGFSSNTTKTLSFISIVNVEPGTYYLGLTYQKTNQTSWYYMGCTTTYPNPVEVVVRAPVLVADDYESNNTQATASPLIWNIDPEMSDFSTARVSLHLTSDVDYYKLSFPLSREYKVHLDLFDKYNSGSQWYVNADAKFAYSIGSGTYSEYFDNSSTVSLNGPTTLYVKVVPYFADDLGFYELVGDIEIVPEPRDDCKSLPYNENFASSQGDFTIENVALDGLSRVWQFASGYGMKASAYVSSTNHPTESWLISPCLEMPESGSVKLTFDHVYRYTTTPTTDLTLFVSEDYESGAPSTGTWTPVTIPTYSSGSNWTFVNAGDIDLSAYAGKYITLGFRYKSSATASATWEIKNVSVTTSSNPTGVENTAEQHNAQKILHNGRILIQRGDHTYDLRGAKVK